MYRRAIVNFCGSIFLEKFSITMIKSSEIALKVLYSYFSIADAAFVCCNLVAKERKVLGSIAIGKVVDKGVAVEDINEGSRAIAFLINSPQYTRSLGGIQDLVVVDREYVKVVELKNYSDLELLAIAALSVDRELIEYLKGRDVALVGEDLSILTFAYYATRYSCRVGIVPRHTLRFNLVKGEHISLYNSSKLFDVLILATHEPAIACLAIKNLLKGKEPTVILYPYTQNFLSSICIKDNMVVKSIALGDTEIGVKVFEEHKNIIMSKLKILDLESLPKYPVEPLFIKLG